MLVVPLFSGLVALVMVAVSWWMPAAVRPTLPFGVRIPPEYARDPAVRRARVWYRGGLVAITAAVAGLTAWAAARPDQPLAGLASVGAVLLLSTVDYYLVHRRLHAVKVRQGWYTGQRPAVAADTGWRATMPAFPVVWLLPALTVILVTLALAIWRYPALPPRIALHYGPTGQPDAWARTTPASAILPFVLPQVVLTGVLAGVVELMRRARQDVDATDPVASAQQQRAFRRIAGRALLLVAAVANLVRLLVAVQVWGLLAVPSGTILPVVLALSLAAVIGLAIVFLRLGQGGSRLPLRGQARPTGYVNRDDDAFWKGGLIYVNRNDPAFFVEKRYGIGWTLNVGHPLAGPAVLALLLILFLSVLLPFLTTQGVHR